MRRFPRGKQYFTYGMDLSHMQRLPVLTALGSNKSPHLSNTRYNIFAFRFRAAGALWPVSDIAIRRVFVHATGSGVEVKKCDPQFRSKHWPQVPNYCAVMPGRPNECSVGTSSLRNLLARALQRGRYHVWNMTFPTWSKHSLSLNAFRCSA